MKVKKPVNITIVLGKHRSIYQSITDGSFARDWDTIRNNAEWIVQLHSPSDKLIPVSEGRFVAEHLKSEYMELERRGHFMSKQLPEVAQVVDDGQEYSNQLWNFHIVSSLGVFVVGTDPIVMGIVHSTHIYTVAVKIVRPGSFSS